MTLSLAIIGDSSSSAIGIGTDCWPSRLAVMLSSRGVDYNLSNYAVPGFTSADAVPLARDLVRKSQVDVLLVYLGNNEGCRSPYKGVASRWPPGWFRRTFGFRRLPGFSLPERFLWRDINVPLTVATTPADFEANLVMIGELAAQRKKKLIVLNPRANLRYPSGVGGGNSLYFIYPDFPIPGEQLPASKSPAIQALIRSVDAYFMGNYIEAMDALAPALSATGDVAFVARCNRACCLAAAGKKDEAMSSLPSRSEAPAHYASVLLHLTGVLSKSETIIADAYDADLSLYRVKNSYRQAAERAATKAKAEIIDLDDILGDQHFVDYCHPTPEGHELIARAVASRLNSNNATAVPPSGVSRKILVTPNYSSRPRESVVDYYTMDYSFKPDEVRRRLHRLIENPDSLPNQPLDKYLANFLAVNRRHPAFLPELDLSGSQSPRSHEVLNFPEFYMYRLLSAYAAEAEKAGLMDQIRRESGSVSLFFSSGDYKELILRKNTLPLNFTLFADPESALASLVSRLSHVPAEIFCDRGNWRIRTVTYWYTRESFRFGTHSRTSMLYERWLIEQFAEGVLVGLVLADQCRDQSIFRALKEFLRLLVDTAVCHEKHAASNDSAYYALDLKNLKLQVDAWIAKVGER